MRKKLPFRAWSYFRIGYAQYFTFILAIANMYTLSYYLIIDNEPTIRAIFPNFSVYVIVFTGFILPILIIIGYVHMKRSHAFIADTDILFESNPYNYKLAPGITREVTAPLFLELLILGRKSLSDEKLTDDELKRLRELEQKINFLSDGNSLPK